MVIDGTLQLVKNKIATEVFLSVTKEYAGKIQLVFTGATKQIMDFCNNGELRWRFPERIQLKDHTDADIRYLILQHLKRNIKVSSVEGGWEGVYINILARRIGRSRGGNQFANHWTLETDLAKVFHRQADRIRRQQPLVASEEAGDDPIHFLTKSDLIGPEPSDINSQIDAWKDLQSMTGLEKVKAAINELMRRAHTNYHRELQGKEPLQTTLNRVFLGLPGTGKTTVAKLYGQILASLGLLSSSEVVIKNPADFIGQYIGDSELNTKSILEATEGKVLIIDDFHMLYQGNGHGTNDSDSFRLVVVDTMVAILQNKPSDDRCVILIGYPDLMQEFFRNTNPGLQRRFPLEDAFVFEDYELRHLSQILDLKLSRDQIQISEKAKTVALEMLSRARDRPNFGNGGDVENLLGRAKTACHTRTKDSPQPPEVTILEPQDFDYDYNRASHPGDVCESLFSGMVGFEEIIALFKGYQEMVAAMRRHHIDPRPYIPFTFVFKGPPGSGKTTTARFVGRIFYEMGFLSTSEVVECSATNLVGQYHGHTGPKTIALLESALGKVLFIDEAYRLSHGFSPRGSGGSFAQEAVEELVDCMTKPRYARKVVIVLAGYSGDMDRMMRMNQGLRGRFATDIVFPQLLPGHCLKHLEEQIGKSKVTIRYEPDPNRERKKIVFRLFAKLSGTKSWANGRDVEALSRSIVGYVFKNQGKVKHVDQLSISLDDLILFLKDMLRKRKQGHGDKAH
ncbi:hypothetical protein ASPWEDRAFT_105830 [Aspergillus wentii DTO 134E9]|uniref:AAA+ ATPase domain-containing protein n=1 Tax=Aspergillus wentii DTO 134E9 TaxID=1073089 RepID=A0A1L9RV37_ASPWE|nr:uncharacterized protein ASPWEDRAFT_105830 [Aspergillus wentii DTO 134E9]OJJ38779.1 hypothetical protein ASPWEDRAFT_105830 [Aspergillus wentii DTO 134E9]